MIVTNPIIQRDSAEKKFKSEIIRFSKLRAYIVRFIYNYNSPCTRRTYSEDILSFLNYFERRSDYPPQEICFSSVEEIHVMAWKNNLMTKISNRSVNRKLSTLSSFFRFLIFEKVISSNPVSRIRRFPQPKEFSTKDFSDEQTRSGILKADESRNIRHIIVVYLLVYTGLRSAEVLSLRCGDIVEIEGEKYLKVTTKGSKERLIFINKNLLNKIEDFGDYINSVRNSNGLSFLDIDSVKLVQSRESLKMVTGTSSGEIIVSPTEKTLYKILTKYFNSSSPHRHRSTVIGHLIDRGVDMNAVASFCGHSDIKTTSKYYQRKVSLKKNAAREIDWGF